MNYSSTNSKKGNNYYNNIIIFVLDHKLQRIFYLNYKHLVFIWILNEYKLLYNRTQFVFNNVLRLALFTPRSRCTQFPGILIFFFDLIFKYE